MVLDWVDVFPIQNGDVIPASYVPSLKHPETNIAPENGWLEYDRFLLGPGLFSGASC